MNRNNRLYGILAAGILTGLVLAVIVAFGWGKSGTTDAADPSPTTISVPSQNQPDSVNALQAENEQLRATLNTMQTREEAYQAQLETANQRILEMQQAPNSSSRQRFENEGEHEEHGFANFEQENEGREFDD